MTPTEHQAAARHLIAQRDAVALYERLPEALRPKDQAEAYAIQAEVARQRGAEGRPPAGWKIACTTAAGQKAMGLDAPAYGMVLADNILSSPAMIAAGRTVAPIAECEIAMRLGSDVEPRPGGHDRDSMAPHVAACMAAIELAEMRYPDRKLVSPEELIADDFFQRAIVLGPEVTDWRGVDLVTARGTLTIAGEPKGEGRGGDVMGHPLAALAWLANRMADTGARLRAGDVVLTGSIAPAVPFASGETAVAAVEGLGEARLTLG